MTLSYLASLLPSHKTTKQDSSKIFIETNCLHWTTSKNIKIFLVHCIQEWNQLDGSRRGINIFMNIKRAFKISSRKKETWSWIKLLNQLSRNCSHLYEHKFYHNFRDSINAIWNSNTEVEATNHFFLGCQSCDISRVTFLRFSLKLLTWRMIT